MKIINQMIGEEYHGMEMIIKLNKSINKLSIVNQISFLERFILLHSIIYYHLNSTVITDKQYDEYARYLEKLIKLNEKEFKESQYYYAFINYSPSTGFDLYDKLSNHDKQYLHHLASNILYSNKKVKSKNKK